MSARAPPCLMLFPSTTSVRSAALRRTPVASSIAPVRLVRERDAACPISTGRGTRRVHLVRGERDAAWGVGARGSAAALPPALAPRLRACLRLLPAQGPY